MIPITDPRMNHLPPHLREVCILLAAGLVRLRRRTAEEAAREMAKVGPVGENVLHFTADQSVHAVPSERTTA